MYSHTATSFLGDGIISDVIKMSFTDKDGHLIKSFQKEKHDTASQLKEFANRNWSLRRLNVFRKKMINLALFGIGRRPTLSSRHCSVQWRRALAASQHA